MKKIVLVVLLIVVIMFVGSFLWNSFNVYTEMRFGNMRIDDSLGSKNIIKTGLYYASEKESINLFVFVLGGDGFSTNEFENYARINSYDDEIDAIEYSSILTKEPKLNVSFFGKIEQGHNRQYILAQDPTYFRVGLYCGPKKEFIPGLGLLQKDCEMSFTEVDEETYIKDKTNIYDILLKPEEIQIYNSFSVPDKQSEEFENISFFEYLMDPAGYAIKNEELNVLWANSFSEILERMIITNPREELDEIINYLDDKNIDIIVAGGKFRLENELFINPNYGVTLGESMPKHIELIGSNRLITTSRLPTNLKFVVKKENGVIGILVDRA